LERKNKPGGKMLSCARFTSASGLFKIKSIELSLRQEEWRTSRRPAGRPLVRWPACSAA
jgi:hypothetical protein